MMNSSCSTLTDNKLYFASTSACNNAAPTPTSINYNVSFPPLSTILELSNKVLSNLGDTRFNGLSVFNFLQTRYRVIDCGTNFDTTIDSNTYTLPVYDRFKQLVTFPIIDSNGNLITRDAVTAIDDTNQTIYFPLTDLKDNKISFPLTDIDKQIISVPKSNDTVTTAAQAYSELDIAYNNAKDAHAFKFANLISNILSTNRVGFFNGNISTPSESRKLPFFAAGVYDNNSTDTDVKDVNSSKLNYFIKYYPDRADKVQSTLVSRNQSIPNTNIQTSTTAVDTDAIMQTDQNRTAASSIAASKYWDPSDSLDVYKSNKVKSNSMSSMLANIQSQISDIYSKI